MTVQAAKNAEIVDELPDFSQPERYPFLIGVYLAINAIPDAYGIIDGPNCLFFKAEYIHGKHDIRSTLLDVLGHHRIAATTIHRTSFINKIAFDPVNDLTPIMRVGGYCFGILVRPDSPFKTLQNLVDYARANPGKVNYMSGGIGTGGHIAMEELAFKAGFKVNHVPSKGDPEASVGLLGGHVDVASASSGWIPLVEGGKLRLLATYGSKRTKRFADVPTVKEAGTNVVDELPMGIFGPKGLPKDLVAILHLAFQKGLNDPVFVGAMDKVEMPILYQGPEEFTKFWAGAYTEAGEHIKKYLK